MSDRSRKVELQFHHYLLIINNNTTAMSIGFVLETASSSSKGKLWLWGAAWVMQVSACFRNFSSTLDCERRGDWSIWPALARSVAYLALGRRASPLREAGDIIGRCLGGPLTNDDNISVKLSIAFGERETTSRLMWPLVHPSVRPLTSELVPK